MSVLAHAAPPTTVNRSKIEWPVLSGQWVRRPRLEARLDRALARSLTVVTAPAGHGKTSTVVSWLRLRDLDAAWVSVDRRDADVTRFASHVAIALERVAPGVASPLLGLLTAPDRLSPHELGAAFGEALYDLERDVVLVLDDVHAAGADAAAAFVAGLVDAAPRRVHTIVCSRVKLPFPLARLRIMGEVEELTGADLRFSPEETGLLLCLETGEAVDRELATSVQSSVGGWPAAIRLVALSSVAGGDIEPAQAVGVGREQLLLDYLGEEVLARLPEPQRALLLRATLVDRFNTALLERLATAEGGAAITKADLDRLRGLELYREIPGLSETWFAYHPLFRDLLRRELERTRDAAAIAELHHGIAQWFAAAGLTRDAVDHLVAAGDVRAAANLIESRVSAAFAREDWQSVASWLRLLPAEAVLGNPELLLASGWIAYLSGREPRIGEALARMRDPSLRHLVTDAQRAEMALLADWPEGEPDAWVRLAETAIARISPTKRYRYGYAHMALGMALTSIGREDEALSRLAAFTSRESAHVDAASIRGYFARVIVLWQTGRLAGCAQSAADLLQLARMNGLPVSAGWGALFLGAVEHERGNLTEAGRHLEAVVGDPDRSHFLCVRSAFFVQILIFHAQGLHGEVDRALARLRELAIGVETPHHLAAVDAFAARIALMRGDLEAARRWIETSTATLGSDDLKEVEHPMLTRAKVLVAVGAPEALAEADRLLAEFVGAARARFMRFALIEGLAVQALLHEARGDRGAAERVLRESLELAAPEGLVQRYAYLGPALAPILRRLLAERPSAPHAGAVLSTLEAVLAAQPSTWPVVGTAAPDLPENPLTERELEVVRLLAVRLTNNEIGEELFISPITVKHHVANIAGKLGVSGRRAAVEHARALGLVG